jgi:hypothetical protein
MLYRDQDEAVNVQLGQLEICSFGTSARRRFVLEVVETMNNIKQKDGPVCQNAIDGKV